MHDLRKQFSGTGVYRQDGIGFEFINAAFASGLNLWQVFAGFQSDDAIGRVAAKRVIESIEINNNSKEV